MGNGFHVKTIKCWVVQSSMLVPLLFIIYTNDPPGCLNLIKSIASSFEPTNTDIYCDVCIIILCVQTTYIIPLLLYDMKYVKVVLCKSVDLDNKLSFNISKTNYTLISCQRLQQDINSLIIK